MTEKPDGKGSNGQNSDIFDVYPKSRRKQSLKEKCRLGNRDSQAKDRKRYLQLIFFPMMKSDRAMVKLVAASVKVSIY